MAPQIVPLPRNASRPPTATKEELAGDAHAWLRAFTGAGFTDDQALELVKAIVTTVED